jgi:hypothetical protein
MSEPLRNAISKANAALAGGSNDAEHDALRSLVELLDVDLANAHLLVALPELVAVIRYCSTRNVGDALKNRARRLLSKIRVPLSRPLQSPKERFDAKWLLGKGGCWLWQDAPGVGGYGRLNVAGVNRVAHRLSWELHRGSILSGLQVLHHCDVRMCVNPEHLFLGTQPDNVRDMIAKGRQPAKLTAEQVLEIRTATGTQKEIASRFAIGRSQVSRIKAQKVWKHL